MLAPTGRDSAVAAAVLGEAGIGAVVCSSLPSLLAELNQGGGFVLVTEETLATANVAPLAEWIAAQEEWSDLPFVLLTPSGGGLERNPAASRYLGLLGNVTFLERPFHPTTLVSLARSALRGRRRQYEARQRLRELREGQDRYRSLFESIDAGFCIIELLFEDGKASDYRFVEINPAFVRQADLQDALGRRMRELEPDHEQHWFDIFGRVAQTGESVRFEEVAAALGRWYEVHAFRVGDPTAHRVAVLFNDISKRRRIEQELRELTRTLEQRVQSATAEREAALAQLHEAQKLETMGHLTGGVAHDFNNLLTPITGALDLMNRRYGASDERAARLIGGAIQSAERARTLVQRLLGFARRQALETRPVELAPLLDGMRELVASSVGSPIELRIKCEPGLPPALADPNQLELAILNLCVNARDAMPEGGVLTITAEIATLPPSNEHGIEPGSFVRVSVIDTGSGMDDATLARAVEPFYSTKEVGKGTGLGLSMVHGLASQLGGGLRLASTSGKGTRADLWLPVAPQPAAPQAMAGAESPGATVRSLCVLLVDDEPLVRVATADMLRDLGHRVVEADRGAHALATVAESEFDVVITDYKMPKMNGAELAARVRTLRPDLPVLLITGYAGPAEDEPDLPRLDKPFRRDELAAALARVVRASSATEPTGSKNP